MNDSDDFLRSIREDRLKRDRRDMKITVIVFLVSLVLSSVLWVALRT